MPGEDPAASVWTLCDGRAATTLAHDADADAQVGHGDDRTRATTKAPMASATTSAATAMAPTGEPDPDPDRCGSAGDARACFAPVAADPSPVASGLEPVEVVVAAWDTRSEGDDAESPGATVDEGVAWSDGPEPPTVVGLPWAAGRVVVVVALDAGQGGPADEYRGACSLELSWPATKCQPSTPPGCTRVKSGPVVA